VPNPLVFPPSCQTLSSQDGKLGVGNIIKRLLI